MYYTHEQQESKKNTHPECTVFPSYSASEKVKRECTTYLIARNLDPELAEDNGWFPSTEAGDKFTRIVIPARTWKQGHVWYQARDVTGRAYLRYQSPKGSRHEALIKVMPNSEPKGIVVLEGPCCALRAAMHGFIGYALCGKQPSRATLQHLALLIQDNPTLPVLVLLDRDCTDEAVRIVTFLASQGFAVKMGQFTKSKDLAELKNAESKTLLRTYFR